MAVDGGGHFLSGQQGHDLFLGRNKLSSFSLLQRLSNEMGKHFNFCSGEQLLNPAGKAKKKSMSGSFIGQRRDRAEAMFTFSGET